MTTQYRIYRWDSQWIWAGDGDEADGTTADLPDDILDAADTGRRGELMSEDGTPYDIRSLA